MLHQKAVDVPVTRATVPSAAYNARPLDSIQRTVPSGPPNLRPTTGIATLAAPHATGRAQWATLAFPRLTSRSEHGADGVTEQSARGDSAAQLGGGVVGAERRSMGARFQHGVEGVRCSEQMGGHRQMATAGPAWVARAIQPLVVMGSRMMNEQRRTWREVTAVAGCR